MLLLKLAFKFIGECPLNCVCKESETTGFPLEIHSQDQFFIGKSMPVFPSPLMAQSVIFCLIGLINGACAIKNKRKCIFLLICPCDCEPCVVINNAKICHSIHKQMTLMN